MRRLLERTFAVETTAERAWAELVAAERWPSWARHLRRVEVSPPGPVGPASGARLTLRNRTTNSSVVTCEMWGFGLMLVWSRDTAAAGGRGAQATHRGPIGGRARPAAHHDRAGVAPASALTHARILLKANQGEAGPGWTDAATAAAMEVNPATVARVRQQYVTAGLDAALHRKPPARQYHRRLDGEQEARLVALACSAPPEGHKRWTLRLLADRLWSWRWWRRSRMRRCGRP